MQVLYAVSALIGLFGYCLYLTLQRLVFSPIARFPGPSLAALTYWYEFYFDVIKRGQFYREIERLHSIYGPIVRINPYELHVRDADWYNTLYAAGGRRRNKSEWFVGRTGGQSVFGTVDHDHHRLRRAALNPFFSRASVISIETLIQERVDRLCEALREYAQSKAVVEMHTAFMSLTLDIISTYAFGECYGLLDKPGFSPEWKHAVEAMTESSITNRHLPWVADTLSKIPPHLAAKISEPVSFFLGVQGKIKTQVEATLSGKPGETRGKYRTIFQELRDSELPASEKTVQRLMDEGLILLGAGADTTAHTLAVLWFHLLQNPVTLAKLTQELQEAIPDPHNPPPWAKLEQLPYLRAVILEAHRVEAVITVRLIRIAPNEDLHFRDWTIPAGTEVSMSTHFIHLDPDIFPNPHKFDPERWLGPDKSKEKYVMPFSKGSRACVGIHLASAELLLTVACLFRRFKFELYDTTEKDVEITWDGFSGGFRPESNGVRIKVANAL
ncbi:hypothetical protein SLS60_007058 [Paraconiothyrium brasiliense]|uniref:Cytochrome P450 n=1 Tax=Paraconiothyrium brasiliense TaxID=300254 RepID=A0ABR3R894_9PLEO